MKMQTATKKQSKVTEKGKMIQVYLFLSCEMA